MSIEREIHVGTPAAVFLVEDIITVHFHKFAKLSAVKGVSVFSPKFISVGYEWCLQLQPGGDDNATDGYMSVFLRNKSPTKIDASCEISIRTKEGKLIRQQTVSNCFDPRGESSTWGFHDFVKQLSSYGLIYEPTSATSFSFHSITF
jgi:hypothetical protein